MSLDTMLIGPLGFSIIASLTWFFSSRPRLFIRVFVPRHEVRNFLRHYTTDDDWRKGLRIIAVLQLAVAVVLGIVDFFIIRG